MYTRQKVSASDPFVRGLVEGIKAGQRSSLAQAITLVESTHPRKRAQAQILLKEVTHLIALQI